MVKFLFLCLAFVFRRPRRSFNALTQGMHSRVQNIFVSVFTPCPKSFTFSEASTNIYAVENRKLNDNYECLLFERFLARYRLLFSTSLCVFRASTRFERKKSSKSGSKKFSKINIDRFMMLAGNIFEMSARVDGGFTVTLLSRFMIFFSEKGL